jgi:hypothetical protein
MHGSKRTAKTKKRTAPLQRSRTQRQKPRRTNNEEFAVPSLVQQGFPKTLEISWAEHGRVFRWAICRPVEKVETESERFGQSVQFVARDVDPQETLSR